MFDSQCDLAALVYEPHEEPDQILCAFASDLAALGYRAAGLVQRGHRRFGADLSALLLHSGEELTLFRDKDAGEVGPRLDAARLQDAARQIARAIDQGADIVIINRFGRQELNGHGLCSLIERAARADIPVVVAVPAHRFANWIKFADGMTVKLRCDREALEYWWHTVTIRSPGGLGRESDTICGLIK
jgi:nucleoside-triphosphatase THEP1